jgi:hypothetical protein
MPLRIPEDGYGIGDIIKTASAVLSTDSTSTSTSFVNLLTVDITTMGGSKLEIYATYSLSNAVDNASAGQDAVQLMVDSTVLQQAGSEQWTVSESGAMFVMSDELAAANHTVALQWRTQAGETIRCSASTLTRPEHASIIVLETSV